MLHAHDVVAELDARLQVTWHRCCGTDQSAWQQVVALGEPAAHQLSLQAEQVLEWAAGIKALCARHGLELTVHYRKVGGQRRSVPTHVVVPSAKLAGHICATEHSRLPEHLKKQVRTDWSRTLRTGRQRLGQLRELMGPTRDPAPTLRLLDRREDTEVELLLEVARWLQDHPGSGLSARQVPVPGIHSKWVKPRHDLLRTLVGSPDLGLVEPRVRPIQLRWLDPGHLAAGGREHDSVVAGDSMRPPYRPRVVVVSENADTALLMPPVPQGVAVLGNGFAGPSLLREVDWLAGAEHLLYLGDIDAAGYEAVHNYRVAGLGVRTLCMDASTRERWAHLGTRHDARGQLLGVPETRSLSHLVGHEREVYEQLCDPLDDRPRRIEQEVIPIQVVHEAVLQAAGLS